MEKEFASTSTWEEVEGSPWHSIISLGKSWLGKWNFSKNGYSLIVTDGINVYGEQRSSNYVTSKAEEWTACIEAEGKQLSALVLSQLKEPSAELTLTRSDVLNKLCIELSASLDSLPYSWIFYLSPLSPDIVKHHWILPLTATLEFMHLKIKKLEDELTKKQRQLDDLLPSQTRRNPTTLTSNILENSLTNISNQGTAEILSTHLSTTCTVLPLLSSKGSEAPIQEGNKIKPSLVSHNRPKLKKPGRGMIPSDEHSFSSNIRQEKERREEIRALALHPAPATKRKRKLNI